MKLYVFRAADGRFYNDHSRALSTKPTIFREDQYQDGYERAIFCLQPSQYKHVTCESLDVLCFDLDSATPIKTLTFENTHNAN